MLDGKKKYWNCCQFFIAVSAFFSFSCHKDRNLGEIFQWRHLFWWNCPRGDFSSLWKDLTWDGIRHTMEVANSDYLKCTHERWSTMIRTSLCSLFVILTYVPLSITGPSSVPYGHGHLRVFPRVLWPCHVKRLGHITLKSATSTVTMVQCAISPG